VSAVNYCPKLVVERSHVDDPNCFRFNTCVSVHLLQLLSVSDFTLRHSILTMVKADEILHGYWRRRNLGCGSHSSSVLYSSRKVLVIEDQFTSPCPWTSSPCPCTTKSLKFQGLRILQTVHYVRSCDDVTSINSVTATMHEIR